MSADAALVEHESPGRALLVLIGALVTIAMIGLLDYASGTDLRIYPLYMLPIAVVAWRTTQIHGLVASVAATAVWFAANRAAGLDLLAPVWVVNVLAQQTAFSAIVLLVAHLQQSRTAERRLARVDKLTGLLNARAFEELAQRELGHQRRNKRPMVFAYVDLDHFKLTNDTRGHPSGDEALRAAAMAMGSVMRATDLLSRAGGDEFMILLVETSTQDAGPVLERIRGAVMEAMKQGRWSITCSIGAVGFDQPPASIDELVRASDALMYEAKQAGGNGVRIIELPRTPDEDVSGDSIG